MHKIGFDDNLGLPKHFHTELNCSLVSYHDLTQLIHAFTEEELTAIFIPAGTLPYITKSYQIIAQATLGEERHVRLNSYFSSLKETNLRFICEKKLGRVNPYCTTSYWTPLIYLMKILPEKTALTFEDTSGFEDLLNKTASGEIPYSMIWDAVLEKYPKQAKKLHVLFQSDVAPTPIIISSKDLSDSFIKKLQTYRSNDPTWFFSGFTNPDHEHIEKFTHQIQEVRDFFICN